MKICMDLLVSIGPAAWVAKATRRSELTRGHVFGLGLSRAYRGQKPEANMDRFKVSR
jgi:hypothetical protein